MTKATNTTTANRIKEDLIQKIKSRQARVCVVGLGYVGLPFAVEKAKVGFTVIGIDQNPRRAQQVNAGISYITDVPSSELEPLVQKGLIKAVTDFSLASTADVIVICVPTPLTRNQVPDLQYVISVTENIARHLRPGQLISLESTTYPGTTEEVLLPLLQRSGLKVEEDYFLCHSNQWPASLYRSFP